MARNFVRFSEITRSMTAQANESGSDIVRECLKLLDAAGEESVASIAGVLKAFDVKRAGIEDDRDLSALGKAERVRFAAEVALTHLARMARQVVEMETASATATEEAHVVPKADVAETMVDLAIVKHVSTLGAIPSALFAMPERIRMGIARMPAELSGLSAEVHAGVVGSLVSSAMALKFSEESQALSGARAVLQGAIDQLAPVAKLEAPEWVKQFRTEWRLPGLVPSKIERLHHELQSTETLVDGQPLAAA